MPQLRILHKTDSSRDEIWEWSLKKEWVLEKKVQKEGITINRSREEGRIWGEGKNVKAEALIRDGEVEINIKLPILYRVFRKTIETVLKEHLQEI